ncbi:hypothetical protein [Microbacterium enclense]|uniref:hypothetical protein n=1 Tax=Microbacterium enclense TaxID=993073 RepID=UPI003D751034
MRPAARTPAQTSSSAPSALAAPAVSRVALGLIAPYRDAAQSLVDSCTGIVQAQLASVGLGILAAHVSCHGAGAWLDLQPGATVEVSGGPDAGTYRVASLFVGSKALTLTDVVRARQAGTPLALRTCHWTGDGIRFVFLDRV